MPYQQLDIFGRRSASRRGSAAVEFRIHCKIADDLDRWCDRRWRYTHIGHGEKRDPVTAARLKCMGVKRGWPDFILVGPGKVCFLELKRHGGVASREQAELATHLMMCGCGYGLATSYADAVTMLQDWGALPTTIHPQ